jgi:hypothetical protein
LLFMEWQSFFLYFAISILSAIILIVTASKIKIFED